jgi:hypothetical protein
VCVCVRAKVGGRRRHQQAALARRHHVHATRSQHCPNARTHTHTQPHSLCDLLLRLGTLARQLLLLLQLLLLGLSTLLGALGLCRVSCVCACMRVSSACVCVGWVGAEMDMDMDMDVSGVACVRNQAPRLHRAPRRRGRRCLTASACHLALALSSRLRSSCCLRRNSLIAFLSPAGPLVRVMQRGPARRVARCA